FPLTNGLTDVSNIACNDRQPKQKIFQQFTRLAAAVVFIVGQRQIPNAGVRDPSKRFRGRNDALHDDSGLLGPRQTRTLLRLLIAFEMNCTKIHHGSADAACAQPVRSFDDDLESTILRSSASVYDINAA